MKETRLLMGMPVTVEVVDSAAAESAVAASQQVIDAVYAYFTYIDEKFSTYKPYSEISLINQGALALEESSYDMRTVFILAEQFRQVTGGYFDIRHDGRYDPSGLVKGWAIANAAEIVRQAGFTNFYVEAGGDFQAAGQNSAGLDWRVGIRSPFNLNEIVKVLAVTDCGVATSGSYIRGQHIYNPASGSADEIRPAGSAASESGSTQPEIVSLTVIGPDIYEADCFATAAFAMGAAGIGFIETLEGFEGYMIDSHGQATFTSGFERYVDHALDR